MLFEPRCFIDFVESNDVAIIEYIDNWADGSEVRYYFLDDDLVIDMTHCIHIEVAKLYLNKINANNLIDQLTELNCPCTD